jgi:hypothetical protein
LPPKKLPKTEWISAARAPKGLVDSVLLHVLSERPGMTQEEVEQAVVGVDDRIAVKSVYNSSGGGEARQALPPRQRALVSHSGHSGPMGGQEFPARGNRGEWSPPAST